MIDKKPFSQNKSCLFIAYGSMGDIAPCITIAKILKKMNVKVCIIAFYDL